jgi:hypothetical protein
MTRAESKSRRRPGVLWACRRLREVAKDAEFVGRRAYWDSTAVASREECLARAQVFRDIADALTEEVKP